jgi:hypothetical protein
MSLSRSRAATCSRLSSAVAVIAPGRYRSSTVPVMVQVMCRGIVITSLGLSIAVSLGLSIAVSLAVK